MYHDSVLDIFDRRRGRIDGVRLDAIDATR
jgi:hypothetical protein